MKTTVFALALVVFAAVAQAQTTSDPRWASWTGCWELMLENVRDAGTGASGGAAATPRPVDRNARPQVCISTDAAGGATFSTTVAGQQALAQTVFANGMDRPVDEADCRGTQRAGWSADGTRLYANARLTCAGDATPRRVSGIALLGPDGTWLDIQAIEVGGRENIRLRRYRRVAQPDATSAPVVRATRLTLADVKEASGKISPRALEAALVETRAGFNLNAKALLDLEAAGVPGSVVDVMVALSYPDRFVIERTRDDRAGTIFLNDPFFLDYGFYSPLTDFYYSPYYFSPFAYSYLGRYDPRAFGGYGYIVEGGGGGGTPEARPSGAGRAVDGLGYTRVRQRDPEVAGERSSSTPSDSSSSSSSSSSSGSSGSSSQGSSSGSSGTDTGRTAVPR